MERLALTRGDVVRVAEGKPRPAIIVQSDRLPTPDRILICPLTSDLTQAPLYRLKILPDDGNRLIAASQLMIDRVGPARRERIDGVIGRLADADVDRLDVALAVMLDLAR